MISVNKGVIAWILAAIILAFAVHVAINAVETRSLEAGFQKALEARASPQPLAEGVTVTKTLTTTVAPTTSWSKTAVRSVITEQNKTSERPQFYVTAPKQISLLTNLALSAAIAAAAFLTFRSRWM